MRYGIVLIAIDTKENAEKLSHLLLDKHLAGCVQLLPMESHYLWQGKKETSSEVLMVVKTHSKKYKAIEELVKTNHPYQVPEILFISIHNILKSYQKWLDESLKEE
ncbi:MAG: divalent-cation tolerance protein CutA [Brevinematales bacterium]